LPLDHARNNPWVDILCQAIEPAASAAPDVSTAAEHVNHRGLMQRVIFACVHNAGRSQMAAAFLSALADPSKVEAVSAGTQPSDRVHPEVVNVMREVGIDLAARRPQKLTEQLANGAFLLVTMGCGDECPYVPGLKRDDWPLEDPKGQPIEQVRRIRDEIRKRVSTLIDAHGWRRPSRSS
jgi:arsenate reductase (thioredoxin)